MLRYEKLSSSLAQQIEKRLLLPGDRLPSVRDLSRAERVSVSTVLRAYTDLESKGLIQARPQSGYYVSTAAPEPLEKPLNHTPPQTCTTYSREEILTSLLGDVSKTDMVPLGAACLSSALAPQDRLNRLSRETLAREPQILAKYNAPSGDLELRQLIAKRMGRLGVKTSAEDVLLTIGGAEGLHVALKHFVKPGDTVMVESPTYYGILMLLSSMGLKILEMPVDFSIGLDPAAVAKVLRARKIKALLVTPNFNNPTGALMPEENKKALLRLAREHDFRIVEDDVYGDLPFGPERPKPLKAYDEEDRVITVGSFSKTLSPGLRIGWVLGGRHTRDLRTLKFAHTVSCNTLAERTLARYLISGGYDRHLRSLRKTLEENLQRMRALIYAEFPEGTKATRPKGGFVLWVELPGNVSADRIHVLAAKKGISVSPGRIFSANDNYGHFLRLNGGCEWTPAVTEALRLLARLVREQAKG